MAAVQKQTLPSFSSIISILSIVFYCVGFIRVELEMNEQKNRINALENVAEAKPKSNDADMKIKNVPGRLVCIKCNHNLVEIYNRLNVIQGAPNKYSLIACSRTFQCFLCAAANKPEG